MEWKLMPFMYRLTNAPSARLTAIVYVNVEEGLPVSPTEMCVAGILIRPYYIFEERNIVRRVLKKQNLSCKCAAELFSMSS